MAKTKRTKGTVEKGVLGSIKNFEGVVRLEKVRSGEIKVINCCKPWAEIRPIDEETRKGGGLIHAVGVSIRVLQEGGKLRVRRRGNLIVIETLFKI